MKRNITKPIMTLQLEVSRFTRTIWALKTKLWQFQSMWQCHVILEQHNGHVTTLKIIIMKRLSIHIMTLQQQVNRLYNCSNCCHVTLEHRLYKWSRDNCQNICHKLWNCTLTFWAVQKKLYLDGHLIIVKRITMKR